MEKLQKHFCVGGRLLAVIMVILFASTAQAQLADSPWPMFRHDQRHTGQSPYVGPSEPNLAWIFEQKISSEPVIGSTGTIYVGSWDKLYAINPGGFPNWTFACDNSDEVVDSAPAIGIDGTIYFTTTKRVYAVDNSGMLKWKYLLEVGSSPVIGADGTIYISADKLYAFEPDGNIKWTYGAGAIVGQPAIGPDSSIYVVANQLLYSISPQGTLNWEYKWPLPTWSCIHNGPTIASDGTLYITAKNDHLLAVNPDGTEKWSLPLRDELKYSWPAVGSDGTIYVSAWVLFSQTPKFYAINPDGSLKWEIEGIHLNSPAIGADGTIYGGGWWRYNKLYAVTPDGKLKWSYDGIYFDTCPAMDEYGTLYIKSMATDHKLYAFYTITGKIPDLSVSASDISIDPPSGRANVGTEVTIRAIVKELDGKQGAKCTVSFYLNDKLHLLNTDTTFVPPGGIGRAEVKWQTSGVDAGAHNIIVIVGNAHPGEINISNNETQTRFTLKSDFEPPSISFVSPQSDSLLPIKGFGVKLLFSDEVGGSGIDTSSLQITCDKDLGGVYSSFVVPAGTNLSRYFGVYSDSARITMSDTLAFPIGTNTLTATIQDSVGNLSKTASLKIKNDFFAVTFPTSGIYVNYTPIKVTGFAVYPSVGRVEINGEEVSLINEIFEGDVNLTEGPNTLVIVGYDTLNNIVRVENIQVILDTVAPKITITGPSHGSVSTISPISIEGTIDDSWITAVTINGDSVKVSNSKFSSDILIHKDDNRIWVKAVDRVGNVGTKDVLVIGNPPGSLSDYTRLYLRLQSPFSNFLSEFRAPSYNRVEYKYNSGTSGAYEWMFILYGDIDGSIYKFKLMLGSLTSTHYNCRIIVSHNGSRNVLASASFSTSSYNWQWFEQTVSGPDPATVAGDTLILRIAFNGWAHVYASDFIENDPFSPQYYAYIDIGSIVNGVEQIADDPAIPKTFGLEQNFPNPFNPETTIKYQLPKTSEITIKIFNIAGQLVETLVEQQQPAGYYSINWNGKDERGQDVASGLYFYQFRAKGSKENFIQMRKMLLVR